MDWSSFLRGEAGWAVVATGAAEFLRRLMKGDFVLRREYEAVVETAKVAVAKADKAVDDANENAQKTIAAQAQVIETLQKGGD